MKNKIKEIKAKDFSKAINKSGLRGYQFKDKITPLAEKKVKCVKANFLNKNAKYYYPEKDVKNSLKNLKEELKKTSKENDWEVAVDDGDENGFRIIGGEEYINKVWDKHTREEK